MSRPARWSPEGVYLALDTSGPLGSVAIARGPRVLGRAYLPERTEQAASLVPALRSVLDQAGLRPDAIDGVVVGAGPGSFTGVRIAAATAKGMAHALGVPLWAFSSLAAGAVSDLALPTAARPPAWSTGATATAATLRWVVFDARGERVYAALYRTRSGRLEEVAPPRATQIGELLAAPLAAGVSFAGDGALRHRDRISAAGFDVLDAPAGFPTADGLIHLLRVQRVPPLADPGGWEPEYLQATSAERERDGR